MSNEMIAIASSAKHPLENRIPPPIVTVLIGAGMWTTTFIELPMPTSQSLRLMVAFTIFTLDLATLVAGFRAFGKSRTTIDPVQIDRASALVTHGIFRFTRNPMYGFHPVASRLGGLPRSAVGAAGACWFCALYEPISD
jgi:protein-S-isoprenylcysteine O-methyltransferase Ste14